MFASPYTEETRSLVLGLASSITGHRYLNEAFDTCVRDVLGPCTEINRTSHKQYQRLYLMVI